MTESFVTQCPHCQTRFRVTRAQLGMARGAVRCGACLQVIAEFGSADTVIEIDGRGTFRLADFLPRPFEAESLKD